MSRLDENNPHAEHWRWGLFYYNAANPELFVEKRIGTGLTINFAHRKAWLLMLFLIAFPFLCLLIPVLLN